MYSPHFETDLELIEKSIIDGNEPISIICNGNLNSCLISKNPNWKDCVRCIGRRKNGISLLSRKIKTIAFNIEKFIINKDLESLFNPPNTLKELVQIKIGNFDLGYAVATLLVDQTKNPEISPKQDIEYTKLLMSIVYKTYLWFGEILDREKPEKVYAMNGRHLYYRAIYQSCLDRGIPIFMHERGGDMNSYMLFENSLPHSLLFWDKLIKEYRLTKEPEFILDNGSKYYSRKFSGEGLNWHSFVSDQQKNKLPHNIHKYPVKIGVFMSSEFEFAAVSPEWDEKPYPDQNQGILRICNEMNDSRYHFFIRAHPNMRGHSNSHLNYLENNTPTNASFISPESEISSYALLKNCDVILTFGSTMAVEACYWGKPSINAGPAPYRSLNIGVKCNTHSEVIKALKGDWKVGSKDDAILYGAMMATYGIPFKHVKMETPFKGTFKGKDANKITSPWRRIALRMASWMGL